MRDGIAHHSSRAPEPATLEGRIVRVMDRVAYINHDIDDAVRAGLLRERDLPAEPIAALGRSGSARIDALVHDMVEHSERAGEIVQGDEAARAMGQLREFMFERVYLGPEVRAERERIAGVVRTLFEHYVEHPELLPARPAGGGSMPSRRPSRHADAAESEARDGEPDVAQRVTDYIAGMTDRYCIRAYTDRWGSAGAARVRPLVRERRRGGARAASERPCFEAGGGSVGGGRQARRASG